jgi:hypothetical protein
MISGDCFAMAGPDDIVKDLGKEPERRFPIA